MIEIIEVAVLRRQHLQQHTGRRGVAFRFAGADEQARVGSCSDWRK